MDLEARRELDSSKRLSGLLPLPLPDNLTGHVHRQELVRLLAEGLRDLGYTTAAASLEAEAGTTSSSTVASEFIQLLSEKKYDHALELLDRLPFRDGAKGKKRAKNLIVQERYLDSLLGNRLDEALTRLQEEVHHLKHENETDLDELAALLACPTFEELTDVSNLLRARQAKRFRRESRDEEQELNTILDGEEQGKSLMDCLRGLLDAEAVVPPVRLQELLGQAIAYQWTANAIEHENHQRTTHSYKRFDLNEPLPLLRQLKEVEEQRNTLNAPSSICRQAINLSRGDNSVQVWTLCFHSASSRFAVGTNDGTLYVFSFDPKSSRAKEEARVSHVFGRSLRNARRVITSIDWFGTEGGNGLGNILCTGRVEFARQESRGTSASSTSDADEMEEADEEEENDSVDDADAYVDDPSKALVKVFSVKDLISSQTPQDLALFPSAKDTFHDGHPIAKWTSKNSFVTAGADGWYRMWKLSTTEPARITPSSSVRVERVVDMAVTLTAPLSRSTSSSLVLLACADSSIRVFEGSKPLVSFSAGDPITSLATGFNSIVATVKSQRLLVWSLHDIRSSVSNDAASSSITPIVFKGYVNKRFRLEPGVGFGDFVALGSEDGHVHVWSTTGDLTREVIMLKGHLGPVNIVKFSPVEPGLVVSCGDDGWVRIWSRANAEDEDTTTHL